jgi:hypothetical protein
MKLLSMFVCAAALYGCVTPEPPKPAPVSRAGMVAKAELCNHKGIVVSSDDPGERLVCQFEYIVGSNYAKCVCRDEAQAKLLREETQQTVRDAAGKQAIRGN